MRSHADDAAHLISLLKERGLQAELASPDAPSADPVVVIPVGASASVRILVPNGQEGYFIGFATDDGNEIGGHETLPLDTPLAEVAQAAHTLAKDSA